MNDLEESVRKLAAAIVNPHDYPTQEIVRAFAAAIQGEKLPENPYCEYEAISVCNPGKLLTLCDKHFEQMTKPPEPKDCDCLPREIQVKIEALKVASATRELKWHELEDLWKHCLSMRAR